MPASRAQPAAVTARGGIVSIDVKSAGIGDPFAPEFCRLQGQSIVAFPKNGALAGVVDEDDRLLAGASRRGDEMGFDTQALEFGAVNRGRLSSPTLPT